MELDDVFISVVTAPSSVNIEFDTETGRVIVLPDTPGGIYDLEYRICERRNIINCDEAYVVLSVEPYADLEIIKSADRDIAIAGEEITYTITVSNKGPSTAEKCIG